MPSSSATNLLKRERRTRDFPLFHEPTHYTVRERWLESYDTYARLAANTAHGTFTSAYLVDEVTLADLENVKRYERVWATVPAAWSETRSLGFDYPGFTGSFGTPGSVVTSGVTAVANANGTITISKTSHGLSAGNYVRIVCKMSRTGWFSARSPRTEFTRKILSVTTNDFTIGAVYMFGGGWTLSTVGYRTVSGSESRSLRAILVNAHISHEYALPGVTSNITNAEDFQPLQPLRFVTSAGEPVTHLTSITLPTNTDWITAAEADEYFVVDSEVRPYLGNILERITTSLPYRL